MTVFPYRQPSPRGEGAPKGRIGHWRYEREWGKSVSSRRFMKAPYPPLTRSPFPKGEGKEEAASPQKRKPTPASLRSAAPSKGRGSRGCALLPLEGGAPKGRRLDGDSGMKESEEMHLKSTINESTLSTAPRSPFPMRGRLRGAALCADFCKRRCPKVVSSH